MTYMGRFWSHCAGAVATFLTLVMMLGDWLRMTQGSSERWNEFRDNVLRCCLSRNLQLLAVCLCVGYHLLFLCFKSQRAEGHNECTRSMVARLDTRDIVRLFFVLLVASRFIFGWHNITNGKWNDLILGIDQTENATILLAGIILGQIMELALSRGFKNPVRAEILVGFLGVLVISNFVHLPLQSSFRYHHLTRSTGIWINPNTFGILMGSGLVLLLGLWPQEHYPRRGIALRAGRWFRPTRFAIVALLLFGLLHSFSRGAWVGALVGSVYLIVGRCKSAEPSTHFPLLSLGGIKGFLGRRKLALAVTSVSGLVFLALSSCDIEQPIISRLHSVANASDFSWRNRVEAYRGALVMVADHPSFGVGWDSVLENFDQYYATANLLDPLSMILNDYFTISVSAGIPALLLFLVFIVLSFRPADSSRLPLQRTSFIPWDAALIVLLVGGWFDGVLFHLALAAPFWLFLELVHSNFRGNMNAARASSVSR